MKIANFKRGFIPFSGVSLFDCEHVNNGGVRRFTTKF